MLKSCGNATRLRKHWCAFHETIQFTRIFNAAFNSWVWNGFAAGYGIGLTVAVPGFKPPPQLRALPLTNFQPVVVGVAWSGKLSHITRRLIGEINVEAETQRACIGKGDPDRQ